MQQQKYQEDVNFWHNEIVNGFVQNSKLIQISQNLEMHRERYKFLSIRYDEERDNEFNEANFDFKNGDLNEEQLKVKM